MARILIVDDDPHIRDVVAIALESAGHEVHRGEDGHEAVERSRALQPDLMVLDIMMPGIDGLEACRRIRAASTVPILFLSARDEEIDRIVGLEVGGDDYLTKPFSKRELVARVKAMLRRVELDRGVQGPSECVLRHGDLEVDAERFEVRWSGSKVVLTVTEFGVLEALITTPGKVFTRSELVERAYRFDNHVTERTIDSHVKRIRKKFGSSTAPIETVFGLGYRLGDCTP